MSRIKIIFLALIIHTQAFAAPAAKVAAAAKPAAEKIPACADRLQGFAIYELAEKDKIEKKTAIFEIIDWSRHSSFEGIVAKKSESENTILEVEIKKPKAAKAVKKQEAKFKAWPENSEYKIADMDPKAVIGNENFADHLFILRLKEGKKVLCEDPARKIQQGD